MRAAACVADELLWGLRQCRRASAQRLEQIGNGRVLPGVARHARHASGCAGSEDRPGQAAAGMHPACHRPVRLGQRTSRRPGAEIDSQDPEAGRAGQRADRTREGDRGECVSSSGVTA